MASPHPTLADRAADLVRESLCLEDCRWRAVGESCLPPRDKKPWEWTWAEHDAVRLESRHIHLKNEFAIGGTGTRIAYIVGTGFQYEFVPRKGVVAPADTLKKLNAWLAEWLALNRLDEVEEECLQRCDEDGEAFLRLFPGDGLPEARFVEPERVRPPRGEDDSRDRMGVRTADRDAQSVEGYWVEPDPGEDPEPVPEAEMVHLKANARSNCRRGVPVYHPVVENLYRCEELLTSMSAVAKARAKIALLIKSANLSREKAEDVVSRLTSSVQSAPDGSARRVTIEEMPYGSIIRTNAGDDWQMPSADVGAADLVEVLQADLRAVGVLLQMPEWMFTGLADAKYSNAFVVESPTLKRFKKIQRWLAQRLGEWNGERQGSLVWKAATLSGLWGPVLPLVGVKVTGPTLESRDSASEATTNKTYVDMGVKDVRLVQEEQGIDPDTMARIAAEKAKRDAARPPQPGQPPAGGSVSQPGTPQPPGPPDLAALLGRTTESLAAVAERLAGRGEWLTEAREPVLLAGEWYDPAALEWVLEGKDRSHLVKTAVVRKDGVRTFVYRRPQDLAGAKADGTGADPQPSPPPRSAAEVVADRDRRAARVADPAVSLDQLAEDLDHLTRDQIREAARTRGLKLGGKKQELAARLLDHAKQRAAEADAAAGDPTPEPVPMDAPSVRAREDAYHAIERAGGVRVDYEGGTVFGKWFGEPGQNNRIKLDGVQAASGLTPEAFDAAVKQLNQLGVIKLWQSNVGPWVERGFAHDDTLPSGHERRGLLGDIAHAVRTDAAAVAGAVRRLARAVGSLFGGGSAPPPPVAPYAPQNATPAVARTVGTLTAAAQTAPGLSDSQRQRYAAAASAVAARIPDAGHDLIATHLRAAAFHPDAKALTRAAIAAAVAARPGDDGVREWATTEREAVDSGRATPYSGAFVPAAGALHLDGRDRREAGRFGATAGEEQVYAHEFGHVLDGPQFALSRHPDWRAAWTAEIAPPANPLTRYAATKPHEGFAEFARLLYGTGHDLRQVEKAFPLASKFWKERGLWPT